MNLTQQYAKYIFGQMRRDEIIAFVDDKIISGLPMTDDLLDLSMSGSLDEFEFERILMKFVKKPISDEIAKNVVCTALRRVDGFNDNGLLRGLMTAVHNWKLDSKYSDLYYRLDHYFYETPSHIGIEAIKECIKDWINRYIESVQRDDKNTSDQADY